MMRVYILVGALVGALSGGVVAVAAKPKPPESVVIKACQKMKPPVAFPHADHVKRVKGNCKTCHHSELKACSSAGCHAGKAEGKKPGCEEMALSKNPFHITCINCHKKQDKAPKVCADCHKK